MADHDLSRYRIMASYVLIFHGTYSIKFRLFLHFFMIYIISWNIQRKVHPVITIRSIREICNKLIDFRSLLSTSVVMDYEKSLQSNRPQPGLTARQPLRGGGD